MTYIDRRIVRLIPVGTTTFSSTVGGLVPASGFDDDKFLCSDRTWKYVTSTSISDFNTAVQALIDASGGGAGVTDGDKGDIIVSGSGSVWTVDSLPISRITDLQTSLDAKVDDSQISAFGATLIDDADAAAARATLELGTLATQSGTFSGTSSGTNTGDQTITLTSDVTGSGTGSFATTIAAGAVSLSKMANMATASFLGRNTAGTGSPEVLSASTARTMLSINNVENTALSTWSGSTNITTLGTVATGTWNATNISIGKGGTGASLTDPNADRLMFWDDSAGSVAWLTLGTNLSITGTTINATGGGGGGLSDGDYGDIVVSGTGTVMTIDSAASIQVSEIGVGSATRIVLMDVGVLIISPGLNDAFNPPLAFIFRSSIVRAICGFTLLFHQSRMICSSKLLTGFPTFSSPRKESSTSPNLLKSISATIEALKRSK